MLQNCPPVCQIRTLIQSNLEPLKNIRAVQMLYKKDPEVLNRLDDAPCHCWPDHSGIDRHRRTKVHFAKLPDTLSNCPFHFKQSSITTSSSVDLHLSTPVFPIIKDGWLNCLSGTTSRNGSPGRVPHPRNCRDIGHCWKTHPRQHHYTNISDSMTLSHLSLVVDGLSSAQLPGKPWSSPEDGLPTSILDQVVQHRAEVGFCMATGGPLSVCVFWDRENEDQGGN
ncbi:hypothetical protein J6590_056199 [Homalodisca vitripennis]|nr:hypothetical protein J6590_056199 [Homalodisca vitripennis]